EVNNKEFQVERKFEMAADWTKTATVQGKGNSSVPVEYSFIDRNLSSGKYSYRLKQIDNNGNFEYFNLSGDVIVGVPAKFDLSQNYPNPFNPATKINFDLPKDGQVSLKIFDMLGRELSTIVNEIRKAGYYTVEFNASNLASGVYFYRISAGEFSSVKKMIVLK
ncbi:MAG TPA: T9SS type A sorting domain-containing protein, partial [Ignavibacteria bacterium]|nr:T9SS type A sorting domain-containing protein [Ignavibacteria bacterium]